MKSPGSLAGSSPTPNDDPEKGCDRVGTRLDLVCRSSSTSEDAKTWLLKGPTAHYEPNLFASGGKRQLSGSHLWYEPGAKFNVVGWYRHMANLY
jgi:hypothetical protein